MLPLAYLLCALAGGLLLVFTLGGRPRNGEAFVGAHLVTGPVAIVFVLGAILVQVAAPLPSTAANVALGLAWPGAIVGLTILPLTAYQRRGARFTKAVTPLLVAAPFAMGHGADLHVALPWCGASALALVGLGGSHVLLAWPLQRLFHRFTRRFATRQPSEWERSQADWQRSQWQQLPSDASVPILLGHARSLAPDVRTDCHARLAAHPELDAGIAAALLGEHPSDALWYVAHHYPRERAKLAGPLNELLSRLRTTWPRRLREDPHPNPWTGDLIPAFDCAIAVLAAGGDTRAELSAWQRELAALPKFQKTAKELGRWLQRIR